MPGKFVNIIPGIFLLMALLSTVQPCFSQSAGDPELVLRHDLRNYFRQVPPEQFFLHTDRNIYSSGDSIWFSLYGISFGGPTQLSGLAYVRLLNPEGQILAEQKYSLASGLASGELNLPDTLSSGRYFLQAFSAWSLRTTGYAAPKPIRIIRPFSAPVPVAGTGQKSGNTVRFFHEGGVLVDSNTAITAIRAADEAGNPLPITGYLADEKGNKLVSFETAATGYGLFRWIPRLNGRIRAVVQFPGAAQPETIWLKDTIRPFGTVLRVRAQEPGHIEFTAVTRSPGKVPETALALVWQNAGSFQVNKVSLGEEPVHFSLSTSGLREGLARFSLISTGGILLGERWVYIPRSPADRMVSLAAQPVFGPDSLLISLRAASFLPNENWVEGSVSVTDAMADLQRPLPMAYENFFQTLGIAPYPEGNAFWDNAGRPKSEWLEPLLLSHPPKAPGLPEVLNLAQSPLTFKPERETFLGGIIRNFKLMGEGKNKPIYRLIVDCTDGTLFLGNIFPDSLGRFVYANSFRGNCNLRVESVVKGKPQNITNNVAWFPAFTDTLSPMKRPNDFLTMEYAPTERFTANELNAWTENFGRVPTRILDTISVSAAIVPPKLLPWTDYISSMYRDEKATLLDFTRDRITISNWLPTLNGRIPGLQILPAGSSLSFVYRGGNSSFVSVVSAYGSGVTSVNRPGSGADLPYFYIDEMRAPLETVQSLPAGNIALVAYYPPPVFFAPYNGGNVGAFLVYMRRDNPKTPREKPVVRPYKGLELVPGFIPPTPFQNQAGGASRLPALYYWGILPANEPANTWKWAIPMNSMKAKKLHITVQGITTAGRWVYWEEVIDTGK